MERGNGRSGGAIRSICLSLIAVAVAVAAQAQNPSYVDTTCAPCRDIYQYANGAWLATAQIPGERNSWGLFNEMYERTEQRLHAILDSVRVDTDAPS